MEESLQDSRDDIELVRSLTGSGVQGVRVMPWAAMDDGLAESVPAATRSAQLALPPARVRVLIQVLPDPPDRCLERRRTHCLGLLFATLLPIPRTRSPVTRPR